jgi:hypothetical protein
MAIEKAIYTGRAKAMGGRVGTAKSDDGQINLKLDRPVEMGGKGNGTNPEQLFAAGYAACFIGALRVVQRQARVHRGLGIPGMEYRSWRPMYTTKRVSSVNGAIWPFASLRSAQWAYASTNSLSARRSAAFSGEMLLWIAIQ